jgi:uncharacterized 2Fe-2S/4Fe-4S cluster protein (DUF4445 family)
LTDLVILLDIGTTTISAEIFDTARGLSLAGGAALNLQHEIGEDVISRIGFALKGEDNIKILQKKAAESVNSLLRGILSKIPAGNRDFNKVFCACNSGIYHILLGIDPSPLITPPYRIREKAEMTVSSESIGFKFAKKARVTFLPNIGGFVGSDAFCAARASGIYDSYDLIAVIDMGTNGEILLGNSDKILASSTAAGPAFEARHIKNGMPAIKGAIVGVKIVNGKALLNVVGNTKPKGIAGSGLIEACYRLYRGGFIDKSGKMREKEFVLYGKGKNRISITQADIRKLQFAKAAILSGIKVLLSRYNAISRDIKEIFLTGSFGTGLDIESIVGIGLLPGPATGKINYIQNAVLGGLRLRAMDEKANANANTKTLALLGRIRHVPLLGRRFEKEYIRSLSFG